MHPGTAEPQPFDGFLGGAIWVQVNQPAPRQAPLIFDRALLRRRLDRAIAAEGDDFLLAHASEDLLERLATVKRSFRSVLDLGTPRPTVAARLADALPNAEITRAAPSARALGSGRWRSLVADEENQPFAPESFDLIVSLQALHAVNDLPGTLVQVRRALKPDGLFLGCLFGGSTLSEMRDSFSVAEAEIAGGTSPRVAPFSDLRALGGLLQRAGFTLPVADIEPITVRYANLFRLFGDLRAMGGTNALTLRHKASLSRRLLARAAEVYAERHADSDGRVRATFEFAWLSGWAPHESQQTPLKPGSARMSLATALGSPASAAAESPPATTSDRSETTGNLKA